MTLDQAVTIRGFRAADEAGVVELLGEVFGPWPHELEGVAPSAFFRWKHVDGAFGPSTSVVAELDGSIVGFVACMPWPLRARGQITMTMRGVDLAVHPSHRRRGASLALVRAVEKRFSEEVAFSWSNPNEQSSPGLLKLGRRRVNTVPRFIGRGGQLPETLRRGLAGGSKTPEGLQIEAPTAGEVLREATEGSMPSDPGEPVDRLATAKDLAYLRWRYGHFGIYRALTSDPASELPGIVVFRVRRHGRFWISQICELLVEGGDRPTARALLRRVNEASATDFTSCAFVSRGRAARHGFVRWPPGIVLSTNPLRREVLPDPTLPASWALSLGDLEIM